MNVTMLIDLVVLYLLKCAVSATRQDQTYTRMVKFSASCETSCLPDCRVLTEGFDCSLARCQCIPNGFTSETRKLILSDGLFKVIVNNSFQMVPNLQYLDLSSGDIEKIEADAFKGLVHLTFLDLSFNHFVDFKPKAFLSKLIALRELRLTRTVRMVTDDSRLLDNIRPTGLTDLGFGRNQLIKFPRFTGRRRKPIFPTILTLNLEYNNIERVTKSNFRGLRSLQKLNLIGNRIYSIRPKSLHYSSDLRRLELDRNFELCPEDFSFESSSLVHLSLAHVHTFSDNRCLKRMFNSLPNLKTLNIARSTDLLQSVFVSSKMKKLENFSLPATGVTEEMLTRITANFPNLRYLAVSENEISVLQRTTLNELKLEVLLLRNNWLSVINITTLPEATWNHLTRVDFSGNALYCDCQIVWFRRWLKKTKNITVENLKLTRCTGPTEVKDVPIHLLKHPTDMECFSEEPDACLLSIFVTVILIASVAFLIALLHRLRWFLKYWYFKYKAEARRYQELIDQREYEFDAFISYSESDSKWVINQLRPRIENEFGLRLCIHHRDWLVGQDIVDNVVDSIAHSRKTVLIVSNAFAVSQWCHFEMTMAQTKLFEDDRDNLILVLLEEIVDCNLNPRLQLQMQKKTYVEWTDNEIGQQLFWEKLRRAVVRQSKSLIYETPPRELLI